jgi:hypothetical protein
MTDLQCQIGVPYRRINKMLEVLGGYYDEMDEWFDNLSFGEKITIMSKYDVDDWHALDGEVKANIYEEERG